jgi:hypothetical protein
VETDFSIGYDKVLEAAMVEPPYVTAVPLAEALKVRVITKGPEYTNFALKPLQKFMWSVLEQHKVFELVGKPVDEWIVQGAMGAALGPNEAYLSGDYSEATNKLAPWVSETIADEIAIVCGLPADLAALFKRALTQHEFVEPNKNKKIGGVRLLGKQLWGQLMGSVVSFPVLCIANAAMCRWSMELGARKRISLMRAPLLINGDDCLLKTTQDGLRYWKLITMFGGLEPSLGKYYFSREFANINSTNYLRRDDVVRAWCTRPGPGMPPGSAGIMRDLWFDPVKFVNLGLLLGMKRSAEDKASVADQKDGLGVRCRELIRDCPDQLKPKVMRVFLAKNTKALHEFKVPWYVPEAYGGVGLPTVWASEDDYYDHLDYGSHNWLFGPPDLDLRICARIREDPVTYPVGSVPADVSWKTWKMVGSRLPAVPTYLSEVKEEIERYDRLIGYVVADLQMSGMDLFDDNVRDVGKFVTRRNERTWKKALHHGSLPPAISLETMLESPPPRPILAVELISPAGELRKEHSLQRKALARTQRRPRREHDDGTQPYTPGPGDT